MGIYATTTSLDTLMPGVTFDTATTALASKLITRAENEVNKYLSRRYDLSGSPFDTSTSIPPLVTSLTEMIAEGYFWKANSRGGKESLARGEGLLKDARENLKMLAEYKADLLDTSGDPVADMTSPSYRVLSNTTNYTPTFAEDSETSWAVDGDKLDDIASERD